MCQQKDKVNVRDPTAQVQLAEDCVGDRVEAQIKQLQPGQVLLLENTRFHKEEEKNDPLFAKQVL